MARAMAFMYASAATLGLIAVIPPNHPAVNELGLVVAALGAYAAVAALIAAFDRLPLWAFHVLIVAAVALVTAAVYFDGRAESIYALFYLWVTVYVFYFLSWPRALAFMLLSGAAYAGVLIVHDSLASFERWLVTFGTLLMLGFLIGLLRRRVQGLIARLADAARTDPLTEVMNRRAFESAFDIELERARRGDRYLSVLVGDLDRFKTVNDTLGHGRGDEVLVETARALEVNKRRIDTVARVGGEEFAILMPESDEGAALVAAERLREAVRESLAGEEASLTISFGLASFPRHGDGAEGLLAAADRALYAAKELGRNRSVIYSAEVDQVLSGSSAWRLSHGQAQLATVLALAETLDARDGGAVSHSQATGRCAEAIARELSLQPERVERVRLAGVVHDVGKVGVPDSVLHKAGPLSESEWAEMRDHPAIGARLLTGEDLADIRAWVLAHHERPDGTGFPNGLRGDEIPLEASIVAVADAYEAMTTDRPYRPALTPEDARAELRRGAGTRFDDRVVGALHEALEREGRAFATTTPSR